MKNKIILIISSVGIGILYLAAKILLSREDPEYIYVGGFIAIVAGIWAGMRFILYRSAYKLALNEFAGVMSYGYKIYNPHIGHTQNEELFKTIVIVIAIIMATYFILAIFKNKEKIQRLENVTSIFWLIAGTSMLLGLNIYLFIFSGFGYFATGIYEEISNNPDKIYARFCYLASGFSIIMIFE